MMLLLSLLSSCCFHLGEMLRILNYFSDSFFPWVTNRRCATGLQQLPLCEEEYHLQNARLGGWGSVGRNDSSALKGIVLYFFCIICPFSTGWLQCTVTDRGATPMLHNKYENDGHWQNATKRFVVSKRSYHWLSPTLHSEHHRNMASLPCSLPVSAQSCRVLIWGELTATARKGHEKTWSMQNGVFHSWARFIPNYTSAFVSG